VSNTIGTDLRYLQRDETARGLRELEKFVLLEFGDPNAAWYLPHAATNGHRNEAVEAVWRKPVRPVECADSAG